ncbi:type III secretion system chaperone [Ramlibacter sp. H39-3-26]|uniref:type III secretion system chaperone n=1 Tax=Curvibacter soli TaxID=3031331 RepID=UPI0023DA92D2|nr:type III secretion system chaperone [Ramlibacter sp. H39-3-26]MDF1485828.1 type III secretion system chaperone [Ramlibacter sp. H39-3-26]
MSENPASPLIAALGEAIGIPALRPDAQGCCRLLFDGDRVVELRCAPAQGRWLVACALRGQRVDADGLQVLMQGNHMGAGFGGGWCGTDAQGHAVLHLPLALPDATAAAMLNAIEVLLDHVERWERRLAQAAPAMPQRMAEWAQRI